MKIAVLTFLSVSVMFFVWTKVFSFVCLSNTCVIIIITKYVLHNKRCIVHCHHAVVVRELYDIYKVFHFVYWIAIHINANASHS